MNKWNARREIFSSMPIRSFLTFCLSVAFTFAAVGAVNDLFDLEHSDARRLIVKVLTSAVFAVVWIMILHRRMTRRLFVASATILAVAQTSWLIVSPRIFPPLQRTFTAEQWRTHVDLHGLLIMGLILFSYGWFGTFFQMEGKRYFAAHTEIELASRIQQQLVPPIQLKTGNVEAYGVSIPSGTVGGDLIDVVEADGFVCAYVADVAGHGVAAGVLMSMVKTAVRMHFMAKPPGGQGLLEAVNNTLTPLTETSAYATFAYLLVSPEAQVTYSVAAHSPIFHLRRSSGTVVRHSVENFPVDVRECPIPNGYGRFSTGRHSRHRDRWIDGSLRLQGGGVGRNLYRDCADSAGLASASRNCEWNFQIRQEVRKDSGRSNVASGSPE